MKYRKILRNCGLMLLSCVVLTACDETGQFNIGQKEETQTLPARPSGKTQDVEAPNVFSVSDQGLWDGRPSLGGVWVAHHSVKEPERAIIRNKANGKSVVGALFRRTRDLPGPAIQLSSDAATSLGILAGKPTALSITALRKKAVVAEVPKEVSKIEKPARINKSPLKPVPAAATVEAAMGAVKSQKTTSKAISAPANIKNEKPKNSAKSSRLSKPYIQIGIFSVQSNASNANLLMKNAGLDAQLLQGTNNKKPFWRVLVGPAKNKAEQTAQLTKIKQQGFFDAYPVKN